MKDWKCPRCPARVSYDDQLCDGCVRQFWIETFENKLVASTDQKRIDRIVQIMGNLERDGKLL